MKLTSSAVVFTLILCLAIDLSLGEKTRKNKKRHHKVKQEPSPVLVDELHESNNMVDASSSEDDSKLIKDNNVPSTIDPCHATHCGAGKVCVLDDNEEPTCICIPTCPEEKDPRRKVCTNHNETWGSDCEVHQMRCRCTTNSPDCTSPEMAHVHIWYYGECRDMPECNKDEMADFPRRMRDWLFNVMTDLADRHELSSYYLKMQREAETNLTRRWSNAAIWKWCDLDGHPHDRSVSRHELFPIRAPLMALEHCISPFLDKCDEDDNHRVTLKEWAKCLEIDEDDIEERCDDVRDAEE